MSTNEDRLREEDSLRDLRDLIAARPLKVVKYDRQTMRHLRGAGKILDKILARMSAKDSTR